MLGAIIGDIAGSRFEFNNHKSKQFELFHERCFVTDDSIMTLALAKAFMETEKSIEPQIEVFHGNYKYLSLLSKNAIKYMQYLGRKYPDCGFGGRFVNWIFSDNPEPYNSYGNGAAMRVSPAGFLARTEWEAEEFAETVTSISHNHEEGMLGAKAVSVAIYMARHGYLKSEIRNNISGMGYSLDFKIDEIRPGYEFNETCRETVPQAIECFLESNSFEDAIRTAVSLGGDSDTLAAITGSIAEAYYGIPREMKEKALAYLDEELRAIYDEWEEFAGEVKPCFALLTKYIPKFIESPNYWKYEAALDRRYYDLLGEFAGELDDFIVNHPKYRFDGYLETLNEYGIDPHKQDIGEIDANGLEAKPTLALLVWGLASERFFDGLMLRLVKNGRFLNWLKRLRDIDRQPVEGDIEEIYLEMGSYGFHSIHGIAFTGKKAIRFEWDIHKNANKPERYSERDTERLLKDWKELHTENWLPYYPEPLNEFQTDGTDWVLFVKRRGGRGKAYGGYRKYPKNWKKFADFMGFDFYDDEDDEGERFIYCSVSFGGNSDSYYYRTDDHSIEAGDRVIVPVGSENTEKTAVVEKVEHFLFEEVPFPLEKTKEILRKATAEKDKTVGDDNILCNETIGRITSHVEARIQDGRLYIIGQDLGVPIKIFGDGEYEFFYNFTKEETEKFSQHLTGQAQDLGEFLKTFIEKFKGSDWYEKFTSYCRENDLKYSAFGC